MTHEQPELPNMSHKVAEDLADFLGIDYEGKSVVGFDVRAVAGQPIHVRVHHEVRKLNGVEGRVEHFTLQPIVKPAAAPAAAFDLDAEVKKAQVRLRDYIDARAYAHALAYRLQPIVRAQIRAVIADVQKAASR